MSAENSGLAQVRGLEYGPRSLPEAIRYFANEVNCVNYLAARRWPQGIPTCPVCFSTKLRFLSTRSLWECTSSHPRSQFSVRAGTVFEDSHIPLRNWLVAIWILANSETPVSSYQMATRLAITQKSAWFMLRRIGCALQIKEARAVGLREEFYSSKLRSGSRTHQAPGPS
jgi:hypothetical protein